MKALKNRIIGVLSIDPAVFEEIEHDENALGPAALVVAVSSVLSAIGGGILSSNLTTGFISILIWGFISWALFAAITYVIGVKLFHGDATMGQMLRVIGFAFAPSAFYILTFIPLVGMAIYMLVTAWLYFTIFIAARAGLDLDNGKTFWTVVAGYFVYLVGLGIILKFGGILG